MKDILVYPSWDQIQYGVAKLCYLILESNIIIDSIVGLSRGGLPPAVMASHLMQRPMIPAGYSSLRGAGDDKNHNNTLPPIAYPIRAGFDFPTLLIIDDICDSGNTIAEVREHYINGGHDVTTAALYYKEGASYTPDFCWMTIPYDAPFIVFPWEM